MSIMPKGQTLSAGRTPLRQLNSTDLGYRWRWIVGMMGWGSMGFGWFYGLLSVLLVLALLGLLLYLGLRAWERGSGEPKRDTALETLRLRYAKGELDEETYRRLRKELEKRGGA